MCFTDAMLSRGGGGIRVADCGIFALTFWVIGMDIEFRTEKLRKTCNDLRLLTKTYGADRAKKIRQRLDELRDARTLADMRFLPAARCHELAGERSGQLAVDISHPYRVVFSPIDPTEREGGGLDWERVTAITVEEIVDYH